MDYSFSKFASRRSVVHSSRGIVSSPQPYASQAGLDVLRRGGNAADAAVAAAAALNVTEPASTGIGGDMFCLYYDAKAKTTYALNGSGRSSSSVKLEKVRKDIGLKDGEDGSIPVHHGHSVTVPGAAAGWVDTISNFGSGKLSLEEILQPAIAIAEGGFPVSQISSAIWQTEEENLRQVSPHGSELLKKDDSSKGGYRAPGPGDIFENKHLANVFRKLAKDGKAGFYEGTIARSMVEAAQARGGCLSLEDLKKHGEVGSERVEPISLVFSGQGIQRPLRLWEHPPNGQGLVALLALGIFQELERAGKIPAFKVEDHNTPRYLHAIIESLRLAFADGTWFIADPAVSKVPVEQLLSPEYLAERASGFATDSSIPIVSHGSPAMSSSDTVYLATSDSDGNACSFINSNYNHFGSAIVPKETGFVLHSRGANFSLGPADHPNLLAPDKRPYHTIIPAMITHADDDSLYACYGVMGAFMQPQGQLQVLLNMAVFGMTEQEALDAPRVCIETPAQSGESITKDDIVYIEEGMAAETVRELEKLGHKCVVLEGLARARFGRGQVIRRKQDEARLVWSAGSDPRGDGCAVPL